jgi:hypothetical protein
MLNIMHVRNFVEECMFANIPPIRNRRLVFYKNILTRKISGGHQAKRRKEGKKPKPEEQEGMLQRRHCPPEKRRGDKNPECHEE